jgi:hypothetical protein
MLPRTRVGRSAASFPLLRCTRRAPERHLRPPRQSPETIGRAVRGFLGAGRWWYPAPRRPRHTALARRPSDSDVGPCFHGLPTPNAVGPRSRTPSRFCIGSRYSRILAPLCPPALLLPPPVSASGDTAGCSRRLRSAGIFRRPAAATGPCAAVQTAVAMLFRRRGAGIHPRRACVLV